MRDMFSRIQAWSEESSSWSQMSVKVYNGEFDGGEVDILLRNSRFMIESYTLGVEELRGTFRRMGHTISRQYLFLSDLMIGVLNCFPKRIVPVCVVVKEVEEVGGLEVCFVILYADTSGYIDSMWI